MHVSVRDRVFSRPYRGARLLELQLRLLLVQPQRPQRLPHIIYIRELQNGTESPVTVCATLMANPPENN